MNKDAIEIRRLEAILDHKMSPMEAIAYKISCIFQDSLHATFPETPRGKERKGDPRKTYLFKVCYKLVRHTKDTLEPNQYTLYVKAQLQIIKIISKQTGKYLNADPSCLIGPKAWKRWLFWKNLYEKQTKRPLSADEAGISINDPEKVKKSLRYDKEFFDQRLKGLTYNEIHAAAQGRSLVRWIATGQVSPYYALLSPVLHKWIAENKLTLDSLLSIDFNLYEPGITPEIRKFFDANFGYEKEVAG